METGSEVEIAGGGGPRLQRYACGGSSAYSDRSAYARATHKAASKVIVEADGSYHAESSRSQFNEHGEDMDTFVGAVRLGYQWESFGFTAGPGIWVWTGSDPSAIPIPSADLWAGAPDVHFWLNFASGPASTTSFPIGLGLATQLDRFRGRIGPTLSAADHNAPIAGVLEAEFCPVGEMVWLGGDLAIANDDTWHARGHLTLRFPGT